MSSEGLKNAVLERARAEAEQLRAEAKTAAEASARSITERAEREAAETLERARRSAAETRARDRSALERETRLKALQEKNAIIERVFGEAVSRFRALAPDELRALYRSELDGLKLEGALLRVAAGSSGLFEDARSRGARIQDDAAIDAGYIIEGADFRLERTASARLRELRTALRGEVARVLFGNGQ
jgi:vacuolar-type H+-ATPase subunit E/Vma4